MAGLFMPPALPQIPTPPPAPSMSDERVQQAAEDAKKNRAGRASTFFTNPASQREAEPTQQRYLGGI